MKNYEREELELPICVNCYKEPLFFLDQEAVHAQSDVVSDDEIIGGFLLNLSYIPKPDSIAQRAIHHELRHPGEDQRFILLYKYVQNNNGIVSVEYSYTEKEEDDSELVQNDAPTVPLQKEFAISTGTTIFHFHRAEFILDGKTFHFPHDNLLFSRIAKEQDRMIPSHKSRSGVIFEDRRGVIRQFTRQRRLDQ